MSTSNLPKAPPVSPELIREKRSLRWLFVSIAVIAALGVGAVLTVLISGYTTVQTFDDRREKLRASYHQVKLPPGLEQRNVYENGDIIDSPEQLGLTYTYRYKVDPSEMYTALARSFQSAGYTVTKQPPPDPGTSPVGSDTESGAFKATNKQQHTSIEADFYSNKSATVSVTPLE